MKVLITIFAFIELIAFIVAIREVIILLKNKVERILTRCVGDIEYRNKFASKIFFFQDMGPSISSFSIISIFTSDSEKTLALTAIFFIGYNMKEISRKFKNAFYKQIEKRSQKCQSEQ